jgi:hypothetical protein
VVIHNYSEWLHYSILSFKLRRKEIYVIPNRIHIQQTNSLFYKSSFLYLSIYLSIDDDSELAGDSRGGSTGCWMVVPCW